MQVDLHILLEIVRESQGEVKFNILLQVFDRSRYKGQHILLEILQNGLCQVKPYSLPEVFWEN